MKHERLQGASDTLIRQMLKRSLAVGGAVLLASGAACVASRQPLDPTHAALSSDRVQLFLEPPKRAYREIASVDASSRFSFVFTGEGQADVVIKRLQDKAAKLGANGLLLEDIADGPIGSVGTAVGTDIVGAHGTLSLGMFGVGATSHKFGRGLAIYLETEPPPSH